MLKNIVVLILCIGCFVIGPTTFGIVADEYWVDSSLKDMIILDSVEVIDQQQTSSAGLGCPFFNYIWLAQGFIPGLESLTKVDVYLFKGGNPTSSITVSIRDSLSGSDLTSVSVDGSLVSEYGKWIQFDFADISLVPGNQYFIVCRSSGGSIINYYCVVFDMYNPYGDGEAWGSIDYGVSWALVEDYYPEYPEPDACFITYGWDESPYEPMISGRINGQVGTVYQYTFLATDPEGHEIFYFVNWGDGSNTGWIGPYSSSEEVTVSHSWSEKGSYTLMAKAKDSYGVESDWGSLVISMPKPMGVFGGLLQRVMERFPIAFTIFNYFYGR